MNAPQQTARIGVVRTKHQRGAGRLDDGVPPMIVLPLREALEKAWGTDAHMAAYAVRRHGEELPKWPRLKKCVLDQIEERGGEVVTPVLVVDYDNQDNVPPEIAARHAGSGRKVPWSEGLFEDFKARVDLAVEERGLPIPNVLFTTAHGARFLFVLREPVNVREAEALHRGLVNLFTRAGLVADPNCSDWPRLFRLPRVIRDGRPSQESPFFLYLEQWEEFLDSGEIEPVERTVDSRPCAPVNEINRPAPSPSECMRMLDEGSMAYREARRRLKGRDCFAPLFDGAPIAAPGHRDTTLMRLVGECVGLLYGVGGMTPEFVYALFLPAVEQLDPDQGTPDWAGKLWHCARYAWAREEAKDEARPEANASAEEPAADTAELPAFPKDIFPPDVEHCLRKAGAVIGDPDLNLLGPAVLSSFSAGVQFHRDSAVSSFYPPGPAGIETLAVAGSGQNKSTAIRMAADPHWKRQVQLRSRFDKERRRYEAEAGARRERMRKRNRDFAKEKDNLDSKPNEEQALECLRQEAEEMPEEPKSEEYMASDTTGEAALVGLAGNRHETGYFCSAEGTTPMTALGHYSGKPFFDPWCDSWSGMAIKVDRIRQGGQAVIVNNPRIAGTYALQPNKFDALRASEEAIDQGFLARKLITRCSETRQLTAAERRKLARPDLSPFHDRLNRVLARPVRDERQPMSATADAEALLDLYHDEVQRERSPGGRYRGKHAPWGNRLLEHVCRLAVNIEVLWNGIESPAASAASMERAIRLVRYFDAHYWGLFGAARSATDPVVAFAVERIAKDPKGRLYQSGLYEEFAAFCATRELSSPPDNQAFWARLKSHLGIDSGPKGKPKYFPGFSLLPTREGPGGSA